jgi:hypothetical protein
MHDVRAYLARMQRQPTRFARADFRICGRRRQRRGVRDQQAIRGKRVAPRLARHVERTHQQRVATARVDEEVAAHAAVGVERDGVETRAVGAAHGTNIVSVERFHAGAQRTLLEPRGIRNCRQVVPVVGEAVTFDVRVGHEHAAVLGRRRGQAEVFPGDGQADGARLQPVRQELDVVDACAGRAIRMEEGGREARRVGEVHAERERAARHGQQPAFVDTQAAMQRFERRQGRVHVGRTGHPG